MNARTPSMTLVSVAGLALASGAASAQQTFYNWTGFASNSWSNTSNWDPAGIPNVFDEVAIIAGGSGVCNLDAMVNLDKIGVGFGSSLNLLNDMDIVILGTTETKGDAPTGIFSLEGTVNMLASANSTDIVVRGDTLTIGNAAHNLSVVNMSNSPNNRFYGVFGSETLNFDIGLVVRGSGQIGVNTIRFNNWGTVTADQPTELVIDPNASGCYNPGTLAAEAGGTMRLESGDFYNTGAIIVRDASVILLSGCTIRDAGTIQTFGTGVLGVNTIGASTWLDAQTVSGTLELLNDRDVKITGATSIATVNMFASANSTDVYIDGPVTLSGGTINMSDSVNNRIISLGGSLPDDALTHASGLIRGSGQVGVNTLDIVNHGSIVADQPSSLSVDPAAMLTNASNGLLLADQGGTLRLDPAFYDNAGLIAANAGSVVQLNGCRINGLLGGSGGYFDVLTIGASTILESVTLLRPLNMSNDRDVVVRGTLNNAVSVDMGATANSTDIFIDGPVAFTGGGQFNLSNSPNNRFLALGGSLDGDALDIQNAIIHGAGQLGVNTLNIINRATVRADHNGGRLTLDPAAVFTNEGLIEASAGGIVRLDGGTFDNTGSVHAADGSLVELNGCTINGALSSEGSGSFRVLTIGASTLLHDADLVGTLVQVNDIDLLVRGTIDHTGDWNLGATANSTDIYIDGPVTLDAGGRINMSNSPNNRILALGGSLPDDFLTIEIYTIHGAGQVCVNSIEAINRGTVSADQPEGTLVIDPASSFVNEGLVAAIGGGILRLDGGLHDHTTGQLAIGDTSRCDLNGCTLTGSVATNGDGYLRVLTIGASTLLQNVSINGRVVQPNDIDLLVRGAIEHTGDWDLQATANSTDVYIDGPVEFSGGGSMNWSSSPNNRIAALGGSLPGDFLTVADYSIHGAGQIGINTLDIANAGAIVADAATVLALDPASAFSSTGLLHAAGTGGMRLDGGTYTTSGQILVDAGSKMDLTAGSFTQTAGSMTVDGEFESDPNLLTIAGGSLGGTGLVDSNTNNTGGTVAPGNSIGGLTIEGNYIQGANAALEIELAAGSSDHLAVTGTATLAGIIRAVRTPGYAPLLGDSFIVLNAALVDGTTPAVNTVGFPLDRGVEVQIEPGLVRLVVVLACVADWNNDSVLDFFDVQGFLNSFSVQEPRADVNDDGLFDFFDLQAFLNAFSAGCP